jgi:hypothetical protein
LAQPDEDGFATAIRPYRGLYNSKTVFFKNALVFATSPMQAARK